jgi:hypothetical protein
MGPLLRQQLRSKPELLPRLRRRAQFPQRRQLTRHLFRRLVASRRIRLRRAAWKW